jgi:hypothetical protein
LITSTFVAMFSRGRLRPWRGFLSLGRRIRQISRGEPYLER